MKQESGKPVCKVFGYGLDDRAIEVRSRQRQKDVSSSLVSRPALGPTQPPTKSVLWVLIRG
jgi:hypothetical protein